MAENQEKRSVTPGLIKEEIYEKPKVYSVNPTLQVVNVELPVATKSVVFTEHLAETITFASWVPPEGELKLTPEMVSHDAAIQNEKQKKTSSKRPEKIKQTKFEKRAAVKVSSEIEILNQATMLNEIKSEVQNQPKAKEINMEIPKVAPQPKVKGPSGMEIINNVMPTEATKETKIQKDNAEVFMVVDRTEVKIAKDENSNVVYLLNNKAVQKEKIVAFMQSISGKVLAMACKSIKIKNVQYKLQGMSYIGSDGSTLSVDDMLELVHI